MSAGTETPDLARQTLPLLDFDTPAVRAALLLEPSPERYDTEYGYRFVFPVVIRLVQLLVVGNDQRPANWRVGGAQVPPNSFAAARRSASLNGPLSSHPALVSTTHTSAGVRTTWSTLPGPPSASFTS